MVTKRNLRKFYHVKSRLRHTIQEHTALLKTLELRLPTTKHPHPAALMRIAQLIDDADMALELFFEDPTAAPVIPADFDGDRVDALVKHMHELNTNEHRQPIRQAAGYLHTTFTHPIPGG